MTGGWKRTRLQALNQQLVTLSRVVLHPAYCGAGLAAAFVEASCRKCPWPWIEALAEMGHLHPFFEHAGFQRVGTCHSPASSRAQHSALYGAARTARGERRLISQTSYEKSRYAHPVYYIRDNRPSGDAARDSGQTFSQAPVPQIDG